MIPAFFSLVPANHVGILYSPFSGVSEETLAEGIHVKNPISKVYKISTEIQTKTMEGIYSQTNDSQYIINTIDVKYKVNSGNAFVIFKQFRTLDRMSDTLIAPTVQRVLEKTTTQYNIIAILGDRRNEMYREFESALAEEFEKSGITFHSVTLRDTDAGEAIEKAIVAEAIAKKAVETAKQELARVEMEAKQKTVQAEADKAAATIKAETLVIEAKSQKEANELLSASISDALLQKMYIEKWNGKLPTVSGTGAGLMLNMEDLK